MNKKEILIELLKTDFQKFNECIEKTDFQKIKEQVNNLSPVEINNMLNYTIYMRCTDRYRFKYKQRSSKKWKFL